MRVFAPAKINLSLHVTGRRDDGYHTLDSLVAFAGVGDVVSARPAIGLDLDYDGPFGAVLADEAGAEDLVLKAARALAEAMGLPADAHLTLTKNLPVSSGIGGGSTDAAAALVLLSRLWEAPVPDEILRDLALGLGADVPVCLDGRAANMGGIGETLDPAPPLPPAWLVLVNPGLAVSTPAVFKARTGPFSAARPLTETPLDAAELAEALKRRANDLSEAAISLAPEIGTVLEALAARPGCLLARMSGSGATCFGLFAEELEAEAAARSVAAEHPDWWCVAAPLLDRIDRDAQRGR